MATEAQYLYFKDTYDREVKRHERLIDRGKVYLSLITLYLGLLGVAADKVIPKIAESLVVAVAYLASLAAFFVALGLLLFALGIYRYTYPSNLKSVIEEYGAEPPTDSEFLDMRMAELAAAFSFNLGVDENRASFLKYASWGMLVGMVFQGFVLASLLFLHAS